MSTSSRRRNHNSGGSSNTLRHAGGDYTHSNPVRVRCTGSDARKSYLCSCLVLAFSTLVFWSCAWLTVMSPSSLSSRSSPSTSQWTLPVVFVAASTDVMDTVPDYPGTARDPGDAFIVSTLDGQVYAMDATTGQVLWSVNTGGPLVQFGRTELSIHSSSSASPASSSSSSSSSSAASSTSPSSSPSSYRAVLRLPGTESASGHGHPALTDYNGSSSGAFVEGDDTFVSLLPGLDGELFALNDDNPVSGASSSSNSSSSSAASSGLTMRELPFSIHDIVEKSPLMTESGTLFLGSKSQVHMYLVVCSSRYLLFQVEFAL